MTYEELLQSAKNGLLVSERQVERQKMAIEAIEKQIPKKLKVLKNIGGGHNKYCPTCNILIYADTLEGVIADNRCEYCPNCGQALNRSGE